MRYFLYCFRWLNKLVIQRSKLFNQKELSTYSSNLKDKYLLELDTFNPVPLYQQNHCGHFWFLLNPLFLPLFLNITTLFRQIRVLSLIARQNFKKCLASDWLFGCLQTLPDCLNYIHFIGYKLKIKLVLIIIKKMRTSIGLDIHSSKVFSSMW